MARLAWEGGGGVPWRERKEKPSPSGLVFKAHRLLFHSTLGWKVIKNGFEGSTVEGAEGEALSQRDVPRHVDMNLPKTNSGFE